MFQEIELKLALAPGDIPTLAARLDDMVPADAKRPPRVLHNTYYDTPDLQLHALGLAVRLRRTGDDALLTVKSGSVANGGLSSRAEWECMVKADTAPEHFDFAHVSDTALRRFLEVHRARLVAVFSTDFARRVWQLKHAGSAIEIALDSGEITNQERRLPLCELELELKSGHNEAALYSLALLLSDSVRLHPEMASKAERGYRLSRAAPLSAAHAEESALHGRMSAREAFVSLAWQCLRQLQSNEAGAANDAAPEFVHQARIAIRRLRSALYYFAPLLPAIFRQRLAPAWRNVGLALAASRDWEVLLQQTLPLLAQGQGGKAVDQSRLRGEAKEDVAQARRKCRQALQHRGYSRLLLEFSAALCALQRAPKGRAGARAKVGAQETAEAAGTLRDFVRRQLKRAARRARKRAARSGKNHPDLLNARQLHRFRIAIKKLRYGLEFFAPLLSGPESERAQGPEAQEPIEPYRAALSQLQDTLGELNDLDVAERLLAGHARKEEMTALRASASRRRQHRLRMLRQHWAESRLAPSPWATETRTTKENH